MFNLKERMKEIWRDFWDNLQSRGVGNNKGTLIAFVITLVFFVIAEYFLLLPINLRSFSFTFFLCICLIIFIVLKSLICLSFDSISKYCSIVVLVLAIYLGVGYVISSPVINASKYQSQLDMNSEADFYSDFENISYSSIPVVDRDSAERLGDRKMGEIVDYVSQFEVDEEYAQINYNDNPYRVTTISYSDLIKWFTNQSDGLPAYIRVNMVTQESEVVRLESGMKYSRSDLFFRNINRYLRLKYPTLMFEDPTFEIDDDGNPYWIAPVYNYKIGLFGGEDITGAVLVNACSGETQYYAIDEVPSWVDRVYPAELLLTQLTNWGQYGNGFINSLISQKGVLTTTDGYNYLALNDDVYLYTGLTSVSSDESNVGFVLINMRTKESNYYAISGAEEYSAMSSAEGKVQNLGYEATFPILINSGGQPTYFLSLKDSAGLVKQYAFVNVQNYQIVAVGESVAAAESNYYQLLVDNGIEDVTYETASLIGSISQIQQAVVDGTSYYYFKIEDQNDIFIASISLNDALPLLQVGDRISIEYSESDTNSQNVLALEVLDE
ncbi:MAG: CvpA family protein [Erysipelotrichaceae bacterium]|nr:CvpA family protein [Erysipelotrichaceae bacterium]